jgi:hypothetical protein
MSVALRRQRKRFDRASNALRTEPLLLSQSNID